MKQRALRHIRGWNDLGVLEKEAPISCYLSVLWYMSQHRNAYWGYDSNLYSGADAFDFDVRRLQRRAYRTNGTTWHIREMPAIVVNGGESALVIVEINSTSPFSEIKSQRTPPVSLAEMARRFWPEKPHTIFRFKTSVDAMKPAELPLVICKSTRRSGRAAWGGERHDIDIAPCVRLVARMNLLLHRHPVGDSDIYRIVQACA
jgi:hypothetical protein